MSYWCDDAALGRDQQRRDAVQARAAAKQRPMTKVRLWDWLSATTALGRRLNARGERIYQAFLRRNRRLGPPR